MINCTTEDRRFYSAHFVSLQVEFVKGQLAIVKNLIRLVKYFRKTCIEDKSSSTARLPSSYQLELVTIGCWEKAGKPSSFDIRAGFKAVLQQLVDNCQIHFIWYNYYDRTIAESGIKAMGSNRFVFVSVQGKLQARPGRGEDAHIKALAVIIRLPSRVLNSRMTCNRVITAAFTCWAEKCDRQPRSQGLFTLKRPWERGCATGTICQSNSLCHSLSLTLNTKFSIFGRTTETRQKA